MKIIRIILLVLIIIGVGLLLTQKIWVPKLVDIIISSENVSIPTPIETKTIINGDFSCEDTPNYFVINKNIKDSVGSNILIKYKENKEETFPCDYVVKENDFEIKNESAEYYLAIVNNFLILDSGTAPDPRGLIIYDLNNHKKIYTDKYSSPISISGGSLIYWNPISIKPTTENCPKLTEYTSQGLGAEIESRIMLNLSNLTKKNLDAYRCSPIQ